MYIYFFKKIKARGQQPGAPSGSDNNNIPAGSYSSQISDSDGCTSNIVDFDIINTWTRMYTKQ